VIPYYYPAWQFGGPVRVAYELSKELVERGLSVTVYTSDIVDEKTRVDNSFQKVDGVDVFYFKNLSLYAAKRKMFVTPSMLFAVKDRIKSFDVVHIHGNRTTQSPILHYFLKKNSVPYIVQAHGGLPMISGNRLKRLYDLFFGHNLLKDASKVIALSRVEAEQYRSMGVPEEKIEVIPNGIDLSEYAVLPPKGCFKKKFGISDDEKIVLYLGRIHRIKGIDILVKAFTNVIKKLDAVRLVIVGPDDGYLREVKALIKTLNIDDNVLITGPLYGKDKLEAYVDAEVYVLPSRYETFPMTVLEAYACGKPVIASKVGGLPDLVTNGQTGLLVDPGNIVQLTKNILYLLDHADGAIEMGLQGKQFVKENFTIKKVTDKLQGLYSDVLSSLPLEFTKSKNSCG